MALLRSALHSLLVVRRDLRLRVNAFDQSGEEGVLVHDRDGDAVETAVLQPNQPGHYGDVADRELPRQK